MLYRVIAPLSIAALMTSLALAAVPSQPAADAWPLYERAI